jgi:hypothetical protein
MCAHLCYCAAISVNLSSMFRDKLPVPSSKVEPLKVGPIGSPETSVRNYFVPVSFISQYIRAIGETKT